MTLSNKIIIRFKKPIVEQTVEKSGIARITGFISPVDLLQIVNAVGLEANPRDAKANMITAEIIDTIKYSPELYPFKTKGLLIAVAECDALERERFALSFTNSKIEGILDGGHNVFAIIKYLLSDILDDPQIKAKLWLDLFQIFKNSYAKLWSTLTEDQKSENPKYNFCIPVELLMPASKQDLDKFKDTLVEICGARNNNVQLKDETKDNKEGLYDYLKNECLPKIVSDQIIWKTNGEGRIPSTEIIALSWIALKPFDPDFSFNKIYSSKGECVQRYGDLIKKTENGKLCYAIKDADRKLVITDPCLQSALKLVGKIPELYDFLYEKFPYAYNNVGGKFGLIKCVKVRKANDAKKFHTKYYNRECEYSYPEGFIIPLICGASSLIARDNNGLYFWKKDPVKFFEKNLERIMKSYKGFIEMAYWDPQTIGKNIACYNTIGDLISLLP